MSTTANRLRGFMSERQFDGGGLPSLIGRYWQVALIVALMALAAGLRLWALGDRAIHHDESIHIKFAWDITQQGIAQYTHDPVYHGPLQYFGTAATFSLLGDSDYTSRVFPALFGIVLVGLPFLLRRQLGTTGAFLAAGFLAVSPALIYFSRFARNDIYVAFFTLAIVVCIWRYLEDRRDGWLIAIAPLLAFSFAAKEVTYITAAILIVFVNFQVAMDLVQQMRASRKMDPNQTALAYAVLLPTAWLVVATWPLTSGLRKNFGLSEFPAAGAALIILGTLSGPQYAAGIQQLPFISDPGYKVAAEHNLQHITVLALIIGGAYIGVLWKWRVWLIAGALFYAPFVLLFTSFFSNGAGFWTGIWGSMDYWLGQQDIARGGQPDYYYLMLLPIYELVPLVFGIGGALYYAFRGKLEQRLMVGAALLLVLILSVIPDSVPLIGDYRIQAAFLVAIGAVLLTNMETFTKFLLFWALSTLFALTVAGEKMPWLTIHIALPLALLAARVLNDIFGSLLRPAADDSEEPYPDDLEELDEEPAQPRRPAPWNVPGGGGPWWRPLLPVVLGALSAGGAATIFVLFGMTSPISIIAWLLSLAALGSVAWTGSNASWHMAGQVAAAGLLAALLVFTVRAGMNASFDQGNADGTPPELLIYAQGSPKLSVIRDQIDKIAEESGLGNELNINIDNSGNIWPWPWYLRDYGVRYDNFSTATPDEGAVVLLRTTNRSSIEPFIDQYYDGIPYTHMWWFPEFYKGLEVGDFLSDALSGGYANTWRDYFIDRLVPRASASPDMIAYFPRSVGSAPDVTPDPDTPSDSVILPAEVLTIIGGPGEGDGQFAQPGGLWVDESGLYIVDTLNLRIQKLSLDGEFIATFGEGGDGTGEFGSPHLQDSSLFRGGPWGIGVAPNGDIYVADTWNHRVQRFDADFEFIQDWGQGEFFGPRDIAFTSAGNLLVVDTGNKRVVQYTRDGELIRVHGGGGSDPGRYNEPSSVTLAPNGDIYVADYWNQRIQHFDSEFLFIDEISVSSWGSQGLTDRAYIAVLDDGTVIATDPGNSRVIVFDPSGNEAAAWTISAGIGPSRPVGVAIDRSARLVYFSDSLNSRIIRVPLDELLPAPEGDAP